jgi:hypothetical protein
MVSKCEDFPLQEDSQDAAKKFPSGGALEVEEIRSYSEGRQMLSRHPQGM